MADEKISQLPSVTNSAVGLNSLIPLVDSNDSTTKSIELSQLDLRYIDYTTLGDTSYGGAGGVPTRLAGNVTTSNQVLAQQGSGSVSAAPAWTSIPGSSLVIPPSVQVLSGSGVLSVPTNPSPLYAIVEALGGGGAGGGAAGAGSSSNGADTTFGSTITASGGIAGVIGNGGGGGGAGGSVSITGGTPLVEVQGGSGGGGFSATTSAVGGMGASGPYGGAGSGAYSAAGAPATVGSGSGGGGGGINGSGISGGGGGAGGYVKVLISSLATNYGYSVGGKGIAGAAGGTGNAGANGGSGSLIIWFFYQ